MAKAEELKVFADMVNKVGLANAKALIREGKVNYNSDWSFDAGDGNKLLGETEDWSNFSKYHLAINPDAEPNTKAYYGFPFGKDGEIYASAVRAIRTRAAQNNHTAIFKEAGFLLEKIKEKESNMAEEEKVEIDEDGKIKAEEKEDYGMEDVYATAEEAEVRAKELGGKGHHEMKVEIEEEEKTMYMPFPTHEEYEKALALIKENEVEVEEEEEEKVVENSQNICDCEENKAQCDCNHEQKNHDLDQTFNISGIEIFSTGIWNGDKYTKDDLSHLVNNFDKTGFQPPVKLGHNEEQPEMKDGDPALGYVDKVYMQGSKLLADFKELPKKVYEAIKRGNYKRVSSEIYWNYKSNGKTLDRVLKAVALLGSEIPAVTNLEAIEGLYDNCEVAKGYYSEKESELMDNIISMKDYEELQSKVQALQNENKKAITELNEAKAEQRAEKISDIIISNKEAGKILPSFEKEVTALLSSATDTKVYSYTLDEKTVELSQFDLVEKIITSLPKLVEFAEVSSNGEFVVDRQPYTNAGDEVDRRAKLYIQHGKADDYSKALELVFADDSVLEQEYKNIIE